MLWFEKVIKELEKKRGQESRSPEVKSSGAQAPKELINDSWTPSGPVHVGSVMSPIIHQTLYKLLKEQGVEVKFQIGFDDFDPFDGIPAGHDETFYKPHLGKPLFQTPYFKQSSNVIPTVVEGSNSGKRDFPIDARKDRKTIIQESFADHYIFKYQAIQKTLGIEPSNYRTSSIYKRGEFDPYIEKALQNASQIRQIYKEISGSDRSANWLPLQPICEKCGKLGTTEAISFNGQEVEYICRPSLVTWAVGCGYQGRVSPFGGCGKMVWRVEWAAKWALFGVTLEAAGKDHANKGGSFDVSTAICEQIFASTVPYKLGHEFMTIEGRKMSSSKGLGFLGHEVLQLFGPEILRFIIVRTPPQRAIEFDLRNPNVILKYFDEFDKFRSSADPDEREIYRLAVGNNDGYFTPRFANLVQWVQMPNIDPIIEAQNLKGKKLEEKETEAVEKRANYAKYWLDKYAPEEQKFVVKKDLPERFSSLSDRQQELLKQLAENLTKESAEDFQNEIYQMGKGLGLNSQETFQAVYTALLGKTAGPKAAWLILSLDTDFVRKRFRGQG